MALSEPGHDKRFYGVYRGQVVDNADPLKKGRVKVKVPQILGGAVTSWAWPMIGALTSTKAPYGIFTSNIVHSAASTSVAYTVAYDTTEDNNGGVTLDAANPSRIYAQESGDYQVLFSPQISSPTASNAQVDIWLRINGVDVPRSNSRINMKSNPNEIAVTVPFIVDLDAGDYFEVAWNPTSTSVILSPFTGLSNPTRPNVPSVITTVSFIGNYVPNPSQGVWVMFEGGDPNFPLWLGAF